MRFITLVSAFGFIALLPAQAPTDRVVAAVVKKDLICITRAGNPALELWRMLREMLEGKEGDANAGRWKGANLPRFPATVLAIDAGELLVSIGDGKTPDAVIRLTEPWKREPLAAGMELTFEGKGAGFARTPFRLTVDVDPAKITVLERSDRDEGTICQCYTPEEMRRMRAGEKVAPK